MHSQENNRTDDGTHPRRKHDSWLLRGLEQKSQKPPLPRSPTRLPRLQCVQIHLQTTPKSANRENSTTHLQLNIENSSFTSHTPPTPLLPSPQPTITTQQITILPVQNSSPAHNPPAQTSNTVITRKRERHKTSTALSYRATRNRTTIGNVARLSERCRSS